MGTEGNTIIVAFLMQHIQAEQLSPEQDIFAAGYVNSLFALQLIMFVEKTFGVRVEDEDLDIANFRSVRAIDQFVQRKKLSQRECR